jgi:hypothetical protein
VPSGSHSKRSRMARTKEEMSLAANKTTTQAALDAPQAGAYVSSKDLEMILEAVNERQSNFPQEPATMAFMLVMQNIGYRFARITCEGGEWEGLKSDISADGEGELTCPDGHGLLKGPGLKIGWILEEE